MLVHAIHHKIKTKIFIVPRWKMIHLKSNTERNNRNIRMRTYNLFKKNVGMI